jgi:hypothetical protein
MHKHAHTAHTARAHRIHRTRTRHQLHCKGEQTVAMVLAMMKSDLGQIGDEGCGVDHPRGVVWGVDDDDGDRWVRGQQALQLVD